MEKNSRLLIVDAVVPTDNAPHPGKVMDILMMVFGEGHERTRLEFSKLLAEAQLQLTDLITTPSALSIIEAISA